jgi:hypothetical protein
VDYTSCKKACYRKMLQYLVTIAETSCTKSDFNKSLSVLHSVRWLSSAWEEILRETIVKFSNEVFLTKRKKINARKIGFSRSDKFSAAGHSEGCGLCRRDVKPTNLNSRMTFSPVQ